MDVQIFSILVSKEMIFSFIIIVMYVCCRCKVEQNIWIPFYTKLHSNSYTSHKIYTDWLNFSQIVVIVWNIEQGITKSEKQTYRFLYIHSNATIERKTKFFQTIFWWNIRRYMAGHKNENYALLIKEKCNFMPFPTKWWIEKCCKGSNFSLFAHHKLGLSVNIVSQFTYIFFPIKTTSIAWRSLAP